MVDFKEYSEVKAGERSETKVSEVIEGTQEEFRTPKYFENVEGSNEEIEKLKKAPAINVVTENGASLVINLPATKIISPKSNLGLWKKTYGDFPSVGQKVTAKTDDNGFQRIVLEK